MGCALNTRGGSLVATSAGAANVTYDSQYIPANHMLAEMQVTSIQFPNLHAKMHARFANLLPGQNSACLALQSCMTLHPH